jgi:hypothetical protein
MTALRQQQLAQLQAAADGGDMVARNHLDSLWTEFDARLETMCMLLDTRTRWAERAKTVEVKPKQGTLF